MPSSDVDQVASMLSNTSVEDGKEISFAGRKLKLDNADQGEISSVLLYD